MASSQTRSPSAVAVVEFFTSQACPDCPEAEEFFSELVADSRTNDLAIFPVALHVDTYDTSDFSDRFSDRKHTRRQLDYVVSMRLRKPYTPQIVVNGSRQCSGDDPGRIKRLIDDALMDRPDVSLELGLERRSVGLKAIYRVSEASSTTVIHFVVVERDLDTPVTGGPNAGKILHNDNVARLFQTALVESVDEQSILLDVPGDVIWSQASVIAYVQDLRSSKILTAAKIDLSELQ